MQTTETRIIELFGDVEALEVRSEQDKPTFIGGYAARFNSRSRDLGGFQEVILPGAFAASITSARDVRALVSHDPDKLLARTSNKSLRLWEDERGLRFEAEVPDTSYARDLLALVKRGTVSQCSFGFRITDPAGESFTQDGATIVRTLKAVELHEVSVVATPAYDATSVAVRIDPAVITRVKERQKFPRREMANRWLDLSKVR
jgi:uncharacterized protein